jgi:hypothetical protein
MATGKPLWSHKYQEVITALFHPKEVIYTAYS